MNEPLPPLIREILERAAAAEWESSDQYDRDQEQDYLPEILQQLATLSTQAMHKAQVIDSFLREHPEAPQ